ncbi:MAG: hypothetical protein ACQETR_04245 [Thermodesulfobacteriota bacterium]
MTAISPKRIKQPDHPHQNQGTHEFMADHGINPVGYGLSLFGRHGHAAGNHLVRCHISGLGYGKPVS